MQSSLLARVLELPGNRRLAKEKCSAARGKSSVYAAWINFDSKPMGIEFKDSKKPCLSNTAGNESLVLWTSMLTQSCRNYSSLQLTTISGINSKF
jgi:hypothetical protein